MQCHTSPSDMNELVKDEFAMKPQALQLVKDIKIVLGNMSYEKIIGQRRFRV